LIDEGELQRIVAFSFAKTRGSPWKMEGSLKRKKITLA
jgi:hypothetical protein